MSAKSRTLQILAPRAADLPAPWRGRVDKNEHERWLQDIQRFRGRIYRSEGAIPAGALGVNGCHVAAPDSKSWHLAISREGELQGVIRLGLHEAQHTLLDGLELNEVLLRMESSRQREHRAALTDYIARKAAQLPWFFEMGGWAVGEEVRNTSIGARLVVACWAVGRSIGGSAALFCATHRHRSAHFLQYIGGYPLVSGESPLGPFYDPYYDCTMEWIAAESGKINPVYESLLTESQCEIENFSVLCAA